ncbi:MAG: class I SAM-dependent methyltransferase, partial [Dehalococcoidia bacterium]|nr:class I SAM-dependent methyltransferase [Dehalococcoidia bacterium]
MALTDTLLPADAIRLRQEDRATMDFIKNVKTVSGAVLGAVAQRHYREEVAARVKAGQPAPKTLDEVGAILNPLFAWQADRFISRHSQEMLWSRLFAAIAHDAETWEAWLRTPVANPKGSLRLNPNLRYPDYYQIDYHVQPGGMHQQPLIPIVLEVGQAVYHSGANDKWGIQYGVANAIPAGKYQRILDLGCSFAHSTIPIKERFPDAEVYGIDMSGPLITYGHRLAETYGFALHLSQQNAEELDFPDNMFDVVTCCILFHEVPDSAA